MSNTGGIAIDDIAVIREFDRQEYIELGLTGHWYANHGRNDCKGAQKKGNPMLQAWHYL